MGVSKNNGTPKSLFLEIPIKMDDFGGTTIVGNTYMKSQAAVSLPVYKSRRPTMNPQNLRNILLS